MDCCRFALWKCLTRSRVVAVMLQRCLIKDAAQQQHHAEVRSTSPVTTAQLISLLQQQHKASREIRSIARFLKLLYVVQNENTPICPWSQNPPERTGVNTDLGQEPSEVSPHVGEHLLLLGLVVGPLLGLLVLLPLSLLLSKSSLL